MLLGIGKSLREPRGRTYTTGSARPHRYEESVSPILYDLAHSNHIEVFTKTFRHMVAFSIGAAERNEKFFRLKIGDRKSLCTTPMVVGFTDPETGKRTQQEGYEELVVECENENYCEPDNRVYAWDEDIREAAWREWRKKCTPSPRLMFKVYRRTLDDERASYCRSGSILAVPVKSVPLFADRLETLIRDFWTYLQRHPDQIKNRKLVYPPQFDSLLSRLSYILERVSENSLFTNPELYEEPQRYTQEYLNVLDAYEKRKLRWPPQWNLKKYEAEKDIYRINRKILVEKSVRLYFLGVIATALYMLKSEEVFRRVEDKFRAINSNPIYSTAPIRVPKPTARGPPH